MSDRDLKKEVLAHWERLAACTTYEEVKQEGYSSEECAYCRAYRFGLLFDRNCEGCPVDDATGCSGCVRTPYTAVSMYVEDVEWEREEFSVERWQELAKAELDFLKGVPA